MSGLRILTAAEQVAAYLRAELMEGRMSGVMPGVLRLEAELGVNRNTVEAALRLMEKDRLLIPQGTGRRRLIKLPEGGLTATPLRVKILTGDNSSRNNGYMVELRHLLLESGHSSSFTSRSLSDMRMEVSQVASLVGKTGADAWVVCAGSKEVLKWFLSQSLPCFALFGRRRRLPLASAGPDKVPAIVEATRALVGHGHRRIVMMTRRMRRLPEPGEVEQAFLRELAACGIPPGSYHLPDWEESIKGFHARLENLFGVTPPTALIIDEVPLYVAAQQFLVNRGLNVPDDVSLVCTDADPAFSWCDPPVSHICWDSAPLVGRIVRWANNVARGKDDRRASFTKAEFVRGGTIGPAKEQK
jgi:DNA-binding LacI/PurR family transcriptional regulator